MNRKTLWATALLLAALALVPLRSSAQIAFRAASTSTMQTLTPSPPYFQAAGAAVGNTGAVSPAWPVHELNDIGLLFCESAGGEAATLSTANGFAAVTNSPQATGAGTAGTRITVFWARASSSSMAAPTVADPGNHVYCQIITYRGVRTSGNPWDVTAGGVKAAASGSVTVTGVTTTVANTLVVQAVSRDDDAAGAEFSAQTNANLTGIAERADAGTTSGNGGGFAVWDGVMANAAATGNTTATISVNTVNGFISIALAPASPTPRFQAAGTAVSGVGTASPAWPTHQANDVALLFCESTGGQPVTLTTANGFAAVTNSPQATGAGTAGTRLTVFWARATSAAMAAPTVADPGDHVDCQILTYRGVVETGNPWDVTAGGVKGVASTTVSVTGVTTTVANTLIVQAASRDLDSAAAAFSVQSNANLDGITERVDAGTTSGNGGGFAVWDGIMATAGATGNTTATVTSSVNAFMSIALLPAGNRLGVPAGTVAGDLMVASIVVRPSTTNILPPSGWTAQTATVQAAGSTSRQQIFYRVATAGDVGGVTYVWRFDNVHTGAVGAVVSYSSVDTTGASPINVISGNTTPQGADTNLQHRALSVTATVPNTMLISTHSFASSEQFTPPSGMTERVDAESETPSNTAGISLEMTEVIQSSAAASGDKLATVTSGLNGDTGTAQLLALRPALHHYAISAVSTTVANCDYAEITITGHASDEGIVAPSSARTVTLTVSAGSATAAWQSTLVSGIGAWAPSGATATYTWPGNESSFTVRLRQSAVITLSVNALDNLGTAEQTGTDDPNISFVTSAFRISNGSNAAQTVGTQIAAKPNAATVATSTYFLQAVRTDTSTGACTTVFTNGSDVAIQVGAQCINPASCTQNVTLATSSPSSNSGTFVPAGAASFPATINFHFATANAEAPFIFNYADAGQIRLQFNYVTSAPAVTITGNSNNFVVRPFGFAFRGADESTAIAHANTQTASVLAAAGDNFTMTLGAYKWASGQDTVTAGVPDSGANIRANGLTPNFAASTTVAASSNVPGIATGSVTRGVGCGGVATIAQGSWSGGSATIGDWCYSEAGNVFLSATSDDYLGDTNADITGNSGLDGDATANGYVGRFRPKQFAVSSATLTNRAALACASTFTYMSERLDLVFTLTAQNTQGGTTKNYHGAYAKLGLGTPTTFNLGARSGSTAFNDGAVTPTNRVSATTSSGTWGNGAAGQEGTAMVTIQSGILRKTSGTVVDGPYTAVNFGIAPSDSDGVAMNTLDLDTNTTAGNDTKNLGVATEVRFGRLRQQNAVASSGAVILPVPIALQYWNGSVFGTNTDDACTTIAPASVTLSGASFTPAGSTNVSSVTFGTGASTGTGKITLTAPGAANRGFVLVTPSLPTYLQGNWTGGSWDQNPSNRAAWGVFGAQPQNFIFQRENY